MNSKLVKTRKEGKSKRVGLFGGTFNPIHLGHLRGAEEIREVFRLEEVVFVPCSIPPHKMTAQVIEASHRLEMVRLAVSGNPHFSVSDVEISRPGKSYSIETIIYFRERRQDAFFFILGSDAFLEIETWKEFQNLFSLCNFIVMTRPGSLKEPPPLPQALVRNLRYASEEKAWVHVSGNMIYLKEISFLDISSTMVRELIQEGRSVRYLISPEVETYIQGRSLYRRTS